jgi:hypothetical protein
VSVSNLTSNIIYEAIFVKIDNQIPVLTHFGDVTDPRVDRTKRYSLPDILFLCVCAVPCGADDCVAIAEFGASRIDWLKQFTDFSDDIPAHDTISRVLSLLDPHEFERAFVAWIAAIQDKRTVKLSLSTVKQCVVHSTPRPAKRLSIWSAPGAA